MKRISLQILKDSLIVVLFLIGFTLYTSYTLYQNITDEAVAMNNVR